MISLKGKTVFITGASAGIGYATAESFAQAGARLILTARRVDKLSVLADKMMKEFNTESLVCQMDVKDKVNVDRLLSSLDETWSDIDILVNNAGLARGVDTIDSADSSNWEEMIDTNIKGLLYVSRAIIPGMIKRGEGQIINLGSIAGHQVYHGGNVYCATKHAVHALTQAMQVELVATPLRVSSVSPGMVDTEFSFVRFGDAEKAKNLYAGINVLTAEDIADAILFCVTRPKHVNINDMIIMPTHQASAFAVHRKS